jgi:uncharacterized membrane protein HdeD (DUF308 family)
MATTEAKNTYLPLLGAGLFICVLAVICLFMPAIHDSPRGRVLGVLLLLAGLAEGAANWARRGHPEGRYGLAAGAVAFLVGLIFVADPIRNMALGYVADTAFNIVLASYLILFWLLVRGSLMLVASMPWNGPGHAWLAASGFADLALFLVLLVGLPVMAFTLSLFGPTEEMIARFSLVIAISFFATGVSLLAASFVERRDMPA